MRVSFSGVTNYCNGHDCTRSQGKADKQTSLVQFCLAKVVWNCAPSTWPDATRLLDNRPRELSRGVRHRAQVYFRDSIGHVGQKFLHDSLWLKIERGWENTQSRISQIIVPLLLFQVSNLTENNPKLEIILPYTSEVSLKCYGVNNCLKSRFWTFMECFGFSFNRVLSLRIELIWNKGRVKADSGPKEENHYINWCLFPIARNCKTKHILVSSIVSVFTRQQFWFFTKSLRSLERPQSRTIRLLSINYEWLLMNFSNSRFDCFIMCGTDWCPDL